MMNNQQNQQTIQTIQDSCPYEQGEIVVFSVPSLKEKYLCRMTQKAIINWNEEKKGYIIEKATIEQKQKWYESNQEKLLIIEKCHPDIS